MRPVGRTTCWTTPHKLGDGDVGLVDDHQGLPGQVVHERRGRLAGIPAGQVPGVVLDAVAEAQLPHHLQVEEGALADALGLDKLALGLEFGHACLHLFLDGHQSPAAHQLRGDVVGSRVDSDFFESPQGLAPQGIDFLDGFHVIAEKLHPDGPVLFVGREDLYPITPHPEGAPVKIQVVALI
jgi:hypothetical protein